MRAKEFINEATDSANFNSGTQPGRKVHGGRDRLGNDRQEAISGLVTIPDWPGMYYKMYRLGVHMAGSPYNEPAVDGIASNEMVMTQYTDVETDIINHSAKAMGVKLKSLTKKGSQEETDINAKSPINKPKTNKYGI